MSIEKKLSKAGQILAPTKSESKFAPEDVSKWKTAISSAESTAKGKPSAKLVSFIINYRIASKKTGKPSADIRRSTLVDLIRTWSIAEHHSSTSTFIVNSYIGSSKSMIELVSHPIEQSLDFLSVSRVSSNNRSKLGNADLQS